MKKFVILALLLDWCGNNVWAAAATGGSTSTGTTTTPAANAASISITLTAPVGSSAADAGKSILKSMLYSPCLNAKTVFGGKSLEISSLKDQVSVKLKGTNNEAVKGSFDYDLYFFFVNLGAKGELVPTSVADAQFYILRRYRAGSAGALVKTSGVEVVLRPNWQDLDKSEMLLRRQDFINASIDETIMGGNISLDSFALPKGTWLAVAILADRTSVKFTFDNPATWAAWDAVPFMLGSPWAVPNAVAPNCD